jgi:hypothetical protein
VLSVDLDSVAQTCLDLPHAGGPLKKEHKRDLSLIEPLCIDNQKGFSDTRTAIHLTTSSPAHVIADITSTEIQIIDDL